MPVIPPLAATDKILDEIASAAVTGHTDVDSSIVSVTKMVLTPSGRPVLFLLALGQSVTVGAQLTTVRTDVVRMVSVVRATPASAVGDGSVAGPRVAVAAEMMLEEMDSAAVMGQTVVVRATVSVRRIVETCSGAELARLVRAAGLAGQLVMLGAQLRIVRVEVVRTVRVVSCSSLLDGVGLSAPAGRVVGAVGLLVITLALNTPSEGVGTGLCPAAEDVEPRVPLVLVNILPVLFMNTSEVEP